MGNLVLALFLILYALSVLGLGIPVIILGLTAGLAGILLLVGR